MLPVYQYVLITIMSDTLHLNLEEDLMSTYYLLSSVVQPDHTRTHLFCVCVLGLQAKLILKPSCLTKLFRCSLIYVSLLMSLSI